MAYNKQDLIIILRAGDRYYDAVRVIKEATQAQRREALDDYNIRNILSIYPKIPLATAIVATLLEGEHQWQKLGEGVTECYKHFRDNKKDVPMSYTNTMNCLEMPLYAAFIAGKIAGWDIRKFYDKAHPFGSPNQKQYMETLGWRNNSDYFKGFGISSTSGREPQPGETLYFKMRNPGLFDPQEATHVALSLGGRQVVSLADRPNQNKTI
jgi:hypothetical protein